MAAGLVVLGGLPATGRTTIAPALAHRVGAAHLRVDIIEQAIVATGHPVGVAGYAVDYTVASDQLCLGLCVVADTVIHRNARRPGPATSTASSTSRGRTSPPERMPGGPPGSASTPPASLPMRPWLPSSTQRTG
ncbi:AAA family ATPase [Lapillicoccus sp.]|uniref:AAA family ATPase n=1 Tax=Lapillicoccus sp. TaxID=1909287 RepID=UPI003983BABE